MSPQDITTSSRSCGQKCQETAGCVAWVWGKDSHSNTAFRRKCFLKTGTGGRASSAGLISGKNDCPGKMVVYIYTYSFICSYAVGSRSMTYIYD